MAGNLRGVDVWFDGHHLETLTTALVDTTNTHGTGCTLAAAINLALDNELLTSVRRAKGVCHHCTHLRP